MPQFLLPEGASDGSTFRLSGPEARHAALVLRCRPGDRLALFDGKGGRFSGIVESIGPDGVITGRLESLAAPRAEHAIVLHAGLLKAARWEWLIEKATELGAAVIEPVACRRAVAELPSGARGQAKLERWRRLATAAAKQSGRPDLPEIRPAASFSAALEGCRGLILLAWEKEGGRARKILETSLRELPPGGTVELFVGPEGGFTEEEVASAKAGGAMTFGLGTRILRAETAALAALAAVSYELGAL